MTQRRINWQAVITVVRDTVLTGMALVGIGYQQFSSQPVKWELLVLYAAVLGYGPLANAIVLAKSGSAAGSSAPGTLPGTTGPSSSPAELPPSSPSPTLPPDASGR